MNHTAATPLTISLNGVDNVGKTTHLRWLHRAVPEAHLVGKIDRWEPRWAEVAAGDFARWWFVDSTTAEHVELSFSGHAVRRAASGALALEDRGEPLLLAACAATAAVKEGLDVEAALNLVTTIKASLPQAKPRSEVNILLRRYEDAESEATAALAREPRTPTEPYAEYQQRLASVVGLQVGQGVYDHVLVVGGQPILDIQQRLREVLSHHGVGSGPLPSELVERLWVLGGLSESGKSTVGELLQAEHGAARLKIGYLLEVAADRVGAADPYAWNETEQAERLSEEVLRYAEANKAQRISIESAHSFESTHYLKWIWGDRASVVYVDAEEETRVRRSPETLEQIRARDTVKRERGADRIKSFADVVIDNAGPLSALKSRLDLLVPEPHGPEAETWEAETNRDWLKAVAEHLADEETALVLATGSTGTLRWKAGWSDMDVLVVRDTLPLEWLRERAATLPSLDGVKVGLSAFTVEDVERRRIPPRVVHSFRDAASGRGVLHRRNGFPLPVFSAAEDDRASRGALGLILMTTRRLLADDRSSFRDLYKHLLLLAKITLLADGVHVDEPDAVFEEFRCRHPGAGCALPRFDDLLAGADHAQASEYLSKELDGLVAYLDRFEPNLRNLT
jgi:thymidylate kinase